MELRNVLGVVPSLRLQPLKNIRSVLLFTFVDSVTMIVMIINNNDEDDELCLINRQLEDELTMHECNYKD